jgi:DNA-binding NtrC family response regulator
MATVLLVDDDDAVRFALEEALEPLGVDTLSAASGEAALALLPEADVVLTDLVMPGLDGFGVLAACRAHDPEMPVVMLTAQGSEGAAVRAWKEGAYDYLRKPFALDALRLVVGRALEARALRRSAFARSVERAAGRALVGDSPAMRRALGDARRVGARAVTVLLRGETGTGKELFASVIHAASARRDQPCVRVNCAALAESLFESELFGHVRGAFTGATAAKPGFFQRAHGGTLVLDEVAELPMAVQAKLLRALQEGEVQPVGASRAESVDVRVVAATHRDLRAEVAAGRFREDLYYRLAVVEIVVPPLRDRASDIPALVECFRVRYAERFELGAVRFLPGLVARLVARAYPGNVRELENLCVALLARAEPDEALDAPHLDRIEAPRALEAPAAATVRPAGEGSLRDQVAAFEAEVVRRALDQAAGNQSAAARALSVSRATLIEKMKRYGLG